MISSVYRNIDRLKSELHVPGSIEGTNYSRIPLICEKLDSST